MAASMMPGELAVRVASLYAPITIALGLALWRGIDRRVATAAFLASAWCAPALLAVNQLAIAKGWWTFHATGGTLAGVPVDLLIGWVVLWGLVPAFALRATHRHFEVERSPHAALLVAALVLIDFVAMPACEPVVALGHWWLAGEAVAVAVVLIPSIGFARWTATGTHVGRRAALQAIAFSGLMAFVLPSIALEQSGGSWRALLDRPAWWLQLAAQLLAIPAALGFSAVQEFAERGGGTPFPADPPSRLVTSGAFAYVANPMQLSTSIALIALGAALRNGWIAAGGLLSWAYGAGFAEWHERAELGERFGAEWVRYREQVRAWRPRWRPATFGAPARLYVAASCDLCSDVGRWIQRLRPVDLEIADAETFPARDLRRLTYVSADGCEDEGIAALARALEHVNLAWAWVGMLMRLPIVNPLVQLLVDASGGQPAPLKGCPTNDRAA